MCLEEGKRVVNIAHHGGLHTAHTNAHGAHTCAFTHKKAQKRTHRKPSVPTRKMTTTMRTEASAERPEPPAAPEMEQSSPLKPSLQKHLLLFTLVS